MFVYVEQTPVNHVASRFSFIKKLIKKKKKKKKLENNLELEN